jgi:transposase-like protein
MRKRFTVEQKLAAIKDHEAGVRVAEICRKYNIALIPSINGELNMRN